MPVSHLGYERLRPGSTGARKIFPSAAGAGDHLAPGFRPGCSATCGRTVALTVLGLATTEERADEAAALQIGA
jgi:hypothetical protein